MADVTTPFGFPYPESTDLVRDGATDIEALAEGVNDALVTIQSEVDAAGGLVAVKSVTDSTVFTGSISTTVDYSDLELTITPSSSANKILLIANLNIAEATDDGTVNWAFTRGGTDVGVADADGSRARVTSGGQRGAGGRSDGHIASTSGTFLDAPASTTALTYGIRLFRSVADSATITFFINRTLDDSNSFTRARFISTLTAMEVRP